MYSTNFGKYYVISKIFRNANTEKEEPHDEAPLLLIVRISILISKKGSESLFHFSNNEVSNPVAGADLVAKGTDAGGCVEVYKTVEDSKKTK